MTDVQDRRAKGASRVSIETLVEICGNEPGIPAFEAEALDVSARGMHLRTAYLPDEGAPLVCRFEDHGREIVVEGVVAWRSESTKGGDFGVAFTALDSRSVDALRELVKSSDADAGSDDEAQRGSRVRLHIEGLGSPMKARVRSGSQQKIQVGSSLEFLRVGRKLEIEDLEAGQRKSALIDGVEVVIDPRTSVPQLVVALRYEGAAEDTPAPTVTDLDAEPARAQALRLSADKVTTDAADTAGDPSPSGDIPEAAASDDDDGDDGDAKDDAGSDDVELDGAVPATTRAARRLGSAAENAGVAARQASVAAVRIGSGALRGMGKWFEGASAKILALRGRTAAPAKRRTTAPAPEGPISMEGKRLRPQSAKGAESVPPPAPRRIAPKRLAVGAAAIALVASAGVMAMRPSKPAPEKFASAEAVKPETPAAAAEPGSPAPALPGATPGAPPAAPGSPAPLPGSAVTANVPLFGPTPLATVEPAPLGPPPSAEAQAVEAAELADAKAVTPITAANEEFPEPVEHVASTDSKKGGDSKAARPEDVAPWGRGKMHQPTIRRLRLDAPGAELRGVADATGFTVLVPGRKLMEQGTALAKSDPRIGRVRTTNTPGGAQVRVTFRENLPSYRVRLRRDYVEFLISAPEETKAKKPAGKEPAKAAAPKSGAKAVAKSSQEKR